MQILRTILTVIFAIDCIALTVVVLMQEGKQQGLGGAISGAADSYWGKNKGRSMEGGLVRATTIMTVLIFCTGSSFEYEIFKNCQKKTLLYDHKSAFFFSKQRSLSEQKESSGKEEVFRKKEICKGQGCKTKGCKTKKKRDPRMGEAGSDP